MEFPSSPWVEMPPALDRLDGQTAGAPAEAVWTPLPARVNHGFTHFQLELAIVKGRVDARTAARLAAAGGVWCPPGDFGRYALSTLMRKVAHAVSAASAGFRWDSDI
jgi:A/G-specific adenine glycosylase